MLDRTPRFLDLASTIKVPAAKRNVAWDEVDPPDENGSGCVAPVIAFIDTNILVAHLTGDPSDMATWATASRRRHRHLIRPVVGPSTQH